MPNVKKVIKKFGKVTKVTNFFQDCTFHNSDISSTAGDSYVHPEKPPSPVVEIDSGCSSASEGLIDQARNRLKDNHHVTIVVPPNKSREVHIDFGKSNVKTCLIYDPRLQGNVPPPSGPPEIIMAKTFRIVQLQVFFTSGIRSRIEIRRSGDRQTHMFVNEHQSVQMHYNGLEGTIPQRIECTTRFYHKAQNIKIKGKMLVNDLWDVKYKVDRKIGFEDFSFEDRHALCCNLPSAAALFR